MLEVGTAAFHFVTKRFECTQVSTQQQGSIVWGWDELDAFVKVSFALEQGASVEKIKGVQCQCKKNKLEYIIVAFSRSFQSRGIFFASQSKGFGKGREFEYPSH